MYNIIFSDRDGTVNRDENYFLGASVNWKSQVEFLPGVVEGIRVINQIPDSYFFILTNQSGVSLEGGDFDNLTFERMKEVNDFILKRLRKKRLKIENYFACPFVDSDYVDKARKKGRVVNSSYVYDGHPDLKPNFGMVEKALKSLGVSKDKCNVFMIGDRVSDIEMILNYGGVGILVESDKTFELGDREKVLKLSGDVYIAKDFLDAANYIRNYVSR